MKGYQVVFKRQAEKQIRKLPAYIQMALRTWALLIEEHGVLVMRKVPGYHDEPLRWERQGQRSSRLSKGYRVFYEENTAEKTVMITVLEVNKHEY